MWVFLHSGWRGCRNHSSVAVSQRNKSSQVWESYPFKQAASSDCKPKATVTVKKTSTSAFLRKRLQTQVSENSRAPHPSSTTSWLMNGGDCFPLRLRCDSESWGLRSPHGPLGVTEHNRWRARDVIKSLKWQSLTCVCVCLCVVVWVRRSWPLKLWPASKKRKIITLSPTLW